MDTRTHVHVNTLTDAMYKIEGASEEERGRESINLSFHTNARAHTRTHTHTYTHTHTPTLTHTYTSTHVHTHTHSRTHTHIHRPCSLKAEL